MSTAIETPTGLFHEAVNTIRSLREENAELKEEIARLKDHVKELNSDLEGTVAECNASHIVGQEY